MKKKPQCSEIKQFDSFDLTKETFFAGCHPLS